MFWLKKYQAEYEINKYIKMYCNYIKPTNTRKTTSHKLLHLYNAKVTCVYLWYFQNVRFSLNLLFQLFPPLSQCGSSVVKLRPRRNLFALCLTPHSCERTGLARGRLSSRR